MTLAIADGVKGLLMASRLRRVVCALTSVAESRMTCSGFGGCSMRAWSSDGESGVREATKCVRAAMVVVRSWSSASVALDGAITVGEVG